MGKTAVLAWTARHDRGTSADGQSVQTKTPPGGGVEKDGLKFI
jgi:hypothetical protein